VRQKRRAVTRTTFEGTLGVGRAAGFQTDRGPIAVLFFAGAGRVRVQRYKTSHGYRYRFLDPPHPGIGTSWTRSHPRLPLTATQL
jgi:hypothetical protein